MSNGSELTNHSLNPQLTTGDLNFYGHGSDIGYDAESGAIPPISTNMPITTLLPWYYLTLMAFFFLCLMTTLLYYP